jgi:hypothetical protein
LLDPPTACGELRPPGTVAPSNPGLRSQDEPLGVSGRDAPVIWDEGDVPRELRAEIWMKMMVARERDADLRVLGNVLFDEAEHVTGPAETSLSFPARISPDRRL